MDTWISVGTRDQLGPDAPLAYEQGETAIGIYEVDGALHAVDDICPHAAANLSQGFVEGCEVECPLHAAVFDVTTGKHLRGEPCGDLRRYPVRLAEGQIQIQILPI